MAEAVQEDVTVEQMPVVGGCVAVPQGPGLGVSLDRDKLEKLQASAPIDSPRFLVRMRYAGGPTIYVRHEAGAPGTADNMRYQERLHGLEVPGYSPGYANPVVTDFWEGEDDPEGFADLWQRTAEGAVWVEGVAAES